jgi:hypothetical protein
MIEDQIKDLSERGLSDQCYIELSNLLCFWCNPNTHEFLLVNEDSFTEEGYAYLFLCPSMCDKVYYKCFDDADLISNNNNFENSKEFCEGLDLDKFYQKDDDLFPKFRVVVTDTNIANCFRGEDDADIEQFGGICLPEPSDKNNNFDPLFYFKGSASSVSSSWGLLLALFFSALLSWIVF